MLFTRSLAPIALFTLLGVARAPEAGAAERAVVLELHAPDGTPVAEREIAVECPEGTRSLRSDAHGRITLTEGQPAPGCRVVVEHEDGWLGSTLGAELGELETITLKPGSGPRPAPAPVEEASDRTTTTVGRTVSMEEFRNIPVGSSTSRDFTAVVESSVTVSADSAGISLAGTTSASDSGPGVKQGIKAARLTAGAVDDVRSTRSFREFLQTLGDQVPVAERFQSPRRVIEVVDPRGQPVAGARVTAGGRTLRTRRDGRVVLVPGWDRLGTQPKVIVEANGARVRASAKGARQRVVVPSGRKQALAPRVDLALVLDATGSMGDEMEYLQAELGTLLARLDARHAQLDIRWGLVVYRDEGDDYVARSYDFTGNFEDFAGVLAQQHANGGGDAPEAVHTAFEHAGQLSWRDASVATRVLLHVADAPPHEQQAEAALRAADGLRAAGTAIYPVAASGVDALAELTMRAMALYSGGQYVFLTDDSGIGNPHREATAACFDVAPLVDVLGRILEAELRGERPTLPQGQRGTGCAETGPGRPLAAGPGPRPRPWPRHHPLERSLFDDDAAADFLHRPRVFTRRP